MCGFATNFGREAAPKCGPQRKPGIETRRRYYNLAQNRPMLDAIYVLNLIDAIG
jgi:hypothetical protein